MASANLTADQAREYLNYDPETGLLTWRVSFRANVAGARAGHLHKSTGYWRVGLCGEKHQAHRLAWLRTHGEWPDVVDHVNGDKLDNRLCNLRSVGALTNSQNRRQAGPGSKSGLIGAQWHKSSGMWKATIRTPAKKIHIGLFSTAEEAHAAYIQAKRQLHPGCTI